MKFDYVKPIAISRLKEVLTAYNIGKQRRGWIIDSLFRGRDLPPRKSTPQQQGKDGQS